MHTGFIVTRFRAIGQLGWAHDDPVEATLPGDPFLDDMVCERGFYFWKEGLLTVAKKLQLSYIILCYQ